MDLRQLGYFRAIVECGSMSKAAERLYVSQPTLSKAMSDLESELGIRLFSREGNKLVVNEYGRYLQGRADSILSLADDTRKHLSDVALRDRVVMNCAMNMPFGLVGKRVLGSFHEKHPEIMIRVALSDSHTFDEASIDVTLFTSATKLARDDVVEVCREDFVAFLPEGHPLAASSSVSLVDLAQEPCIMSEPSELTRTVESMFDEVGAVPFLGSATSTHFDSLMLVGMGMGYCIGGALTWDIGQGGARGYVTRPLDDVSRSRFVYARVMEGAGAAADLFLAHVRRICPLVDVSD